MKPFDNLPSEIEFPCRYVLNECRFPETGDRIRSKEDLFHEPPAHL